MVEVAGIEPTLHDYRSCVLTIVRYFYWRGIGELNPYLLIDSQV